MAKKLGNAWLTVPQPRLGGAGLIALMVSGMLINAVSLDMYTPAIPSLVTDLGTTPEVLNITMFGFFFVNSFALLLAGPISDRRGRKPVFLAGTLFYVAGSIGCALSPNIAALVVFRLLQAIGGGTMGAIGTAVVKDAVVPESREAILAVVNVTFIVGPVIAPVIGALILQVATWRMTFWVLALLGAFGVLLGSLFAETLPENERTDLGTLRSMTRLAVVTKNKGFTLFLLALVVFEIPFCAYLATAPYIYIDFFHVGELGYSMFFALSALLSCTGPIAWVLVSKHTTARKATWASLIISFFVGVALVVVGGASPWAFWGLFLVLAFFSSFTRPYATNILLSQQDGDTGAASSVINFMYNIAGCIGMIVAVGPWPTYVVGVGCIMCLSMLLGLAFWVYLLRAPVRLLGIKKPEDAKGR